MKLIIKKWVVQRLGYDTLKDFDVPSRESWDTWRHDCEIDLADLSAKQLDDLEAILGHHKKTHGIAVLMFDIRTWRKILAGGASTLKARTVRQFEQVLIAYMLDAPGHRLYRRHEEGAMLCYYMNDVKYHPPNEGRSGGPEPAYVSATLLYESIGGLDRTSISFHAEDCRNIPVARALADKGYVIETDELRKDYLKNTEDFVRVSGQVGKQYWGAGKAYHPKFRNSWDSRGATKLDGPDGEPSRVVVDVFWEGDEKPDRDNYANVSTWFWPNVRNSTGYDSETDTDSEDYDEDAPSGKLNEDTELKIPVIEVPIHPWVIVFHLQKHDRLKTHVAQLDEYVYDKNLADKLVLPERQKSLVKLLIDTQGGAFQDIVRGKGGGAVVLLTGQPGTGKTLTAEVYAESEERALYSVQCSQLGVKPEELEEELMLCFARARRWNAVMLLDEADVYVHERGDNMAQNAIVGVFLRVLEYQATILFLTSNRPEDVDDAIASRCIARLYYIPPVADDAKKIWRILADNSGIKISDKVIAEFTAKNPNVTGRDIKNILKLAGLMDGAEGGVTLKNIEYVQEFKPTGAVAGVKPSGVRLHHPRAITESG